MDAQLSPQGPKRARLGGNACHGHRKQNCPLIRGGLVSLSYGTNNIRKVSDHDYGECVGFHGFLLVWQP